MKDEQDKAITEKTAAKITAEFWAAPDDALFKSGETAIVRRCSTAKLDYEAWRGVGVPFIKDGSTRLYQKRKIVAHLKKSEVAVVEAVHA